MKRFDHINVIPLIDVMLVLLAIVLTSASFIAKDNLKITLPETHNTQSYAPEKNEHPLNININAQNQIFEDETPITLTELNLKLAQLNSKHPIVLQVDQQAKFKGFVSVVDLLKKYHLTQLSILTQKP